MQKLERVNGFLDLDKYFEDVKSVQGYSDFDLIIDEFIIDSYYNIGHYWLKINGEYYYYKWTADLYEELIVSECAKLLNVDAVSYDLAIFKETEGVISKSYRKDNHKYISGMDILYNYVLDERNHSYLEAMGCNIDELKALNNHSDIAEYIHNLEICWQAIEYHYQNLEINIDVDKIMNKMLKLFCFNILIGQYDGFPQNWEIDESEEGIDLAPFYDGSSSFGNRCFEPRQSMAVSFEDKSINNYRTLEEFFKISSQEYIDVFLDMFDKFTLEEFMKIIKQVEIKINKKLPSMTRRRMIESFSFNKEEIEKIIKQQRVNGAR